MFPAKFCHIENGLHVAHDYGDVFFEEPSGSSTRLMIGPSKNQVGLMDTLSAEFAGCPWWALYVLLVPRLRKRELGRYELKPFETHDELSSFLKNFKDFFENDGRHHLWIGSAARDGLLVYDNHNVIFAYGPIAKFRAILQSRGFRESPFKYPAPHSHSYAAEYDLEEERLMSGTPWRYSPLQPGDDP